MSVLNSAQKQELQAKMQQLIINVKLEGRNLRIGNQTFTLPTSNNSTVLQNKTVTTR